MVADIRIVVNGNTLSEVTDKPAGFGAPLGDAVRSLVCAPLLESLHHTGADVTDLLSPFLPIPPVLPNMTGRPWVLGRGLP